MSDPVGRRCSATNLYVVPAAGEHGYRVTKDRGERGVLQGYPNKWVGPLPPGVEADKRGRFDSVGSTVYFAASPECAFAETLTGFRKELLKIAPLAELVGAASAEEYAARIVAEAKGNDVDEPWAISGEWQMARSIYRVQMPAEGWWVQIDHPDTINALGSQLATLLARAAVHQGPITSAEVEGPNRDLTTLVAEHVRGLVLDTGHEPLGISFRSKTLYGRCWAFFDRRQDADLPVGVNDPRLLGSTNVDTPAFQKVAKDLGLPILPGRRRY